MGIARLARTCWYVRVTEGSREPNPAAPQWSRNPGAPQWMTARKREEEEEEAAGNCDGWGLPRNTAELQETAEPLPVDVPGDGGCLSVPLRWNNDV